jgi:hypothetical protein
MTELEYQERVLAHARKLGYSEPEVVERYHWLFRSDFGATALVLYMRPPGASWAADLESCWRGSRQRLTADHNRAKGIRPKPRKPRRPKSDTPTECFDSDWLHAFGPDIDDYPDEMEGGKWLMFVREQNVDETWAKIKAEVEAGRLAFYAKISTALVQIGQGPYVLCVYAPDWTNTAEVMEIRERLRELGFKRKIPFKTNAMTRSGESGSVFSA